MGKAPAFQFYPGDWIQDTRILTPLTRGVWIDMLCFMWRSEERGTISGSVDQLARLLSCTRQEIETAINELSVTRIADVTKCNDVVTVTNRRMAKEEKERKNTRLRVEKYRNKLCNAASNGVRNDVVTAPSSSSSSLESKILEDTLPSTINPTFVERGVSVLAETPSVDKEKASRRSQMPEDFKLTPEREAYAKAKGLNGNIPTVWEAFVLHHQSKGTVMKDWNKAWMKWVLNEVKFNPTYQAKSKRTGLEDWMNLPDDNGGDVPL